MKLDKKNRALLLDRSSEALREIGILWLCFSFLDKIVLEKLTPAWAAWNLIASAALWIFGLYLEGAAKELR
jgi:hypothetical protein